MKWQANTQRALIAVVEVLGLCVWFSAAAVAPGLRSEWAIGATAAAWLTASVQIGFVAGAVISSVFNLADRGAPQKLLAVSTLSAAVCTGAVTLVSTGLGTADLQQFSTAAQYRAALALWFRVDFAMRAGFGLGVARKSAY